MKACRKGRCQTEWHRVDLLVQTGAQNAVIEFKFYWDRPTLRLDGIPSHLKGGAGPKNFGEFQGCVRKLHRLRHDGIHRKYLVLVYARTSTRKRRYSYALSYDGLKPKGWVKMAKTIRHSVARQVACKLIEVV